MHGTTTQLLRNHSPVVPKDLIGTITGHLVKPGMNHHLCQHEPLLIVINMYHQCKSYPSLAKTRGMSGRVASATTNVCRKPASTLVSCVAAAGSLTPYCKKYNKMVPVLSHRHHRKEVPKHYFTSICSD